MFLDPVRDLLTPRLVAPGPLWSLEPEFMERYGLQGAILDVDNTIVGADELEPPPEALAWLHDLRDRHPVWLVSNNFSEKRIATIAHTLQLPYRSRAGKPSRRTLREVLAVMALAPPTVAMVGDRLFTDILVGNRLGLFTVLVQPPVATGGGWGQRSRTLRNWEIWVARQTGVLL
ncbi:MAG: YqeG family HAD IIIA-type phosphatase [Oscillatoriales cyanobacterium SM2_1_8]|nr:YqeG family HAD IIIA-type phosphatase [Oscillatoriales cyanobacterium SM2_1_8]